MRPIFTKKPVQTKRRKRTPVISLLFPAGLMMIFMIFNAAIAEPPHERGIVTDGTIGNAGQVSLAGPDYVIDESYGQLKGANLFHSFQRFNIHSDESATFTGPDTVKNIVSRVTGGEASLIDGKLRSTIPGADLYLLNPSGVIFGSHASLNLSGSFHVSTADYLRLGIDDRFFSTPIEGEVLSASAPEAFGFLGDDPSSILVQGRGEIALQESDESGGLEVSEGNDIALVAGTIEITQGAYRKTSQTDEEGGTQSTIKRLADIKAPGGQITLAAVKSSGEVKIGENAPEVTATQMGDITLSDHALIDAGGASDGAIFVRGGRFEMNDSALNAVVQGDQNAGQIDIKTDTAAINQGSEIRGDTLGNGNGCKITIEAKESITVTGENEAGEVSGICASSVNAEGNGGEIQIASNQIRFENGARINAATSGKGNGGKIALNATGDIYFGGENSKGKTSEILLSTTGLSPDAGTGGDLFMEAENIIFENGVFVTSETAGGGKGGNIDLRANGRISMTGRDSSGWGCNVYSVTSPESTGGEGGDIRIDAGEILLTDGVFLTTTAYGAGNAGDVTVRASGRITLKGTDGAEGWVTTISSGSNPRREGQSGGKGGNVLVEAGELVLEDGAQISSNSIAPEGKSSQDAGTVTIQVAGETRIFGVNPHGENEDGFGSGIYARSWGEGDSAGAGGKISIETGSLSIMDGGVIESGTNNNAPGGNIVISVKDAIILSGDASAISLEAPLESHTEYLETFQPSSYNRSISGIYSNSKSTSPTGGPGGAIDINTHTLELLEGSKLSAATQGGGEGGDIHLNASGDIRVSGENSEGTTSSMFLSTAALYPEAGSGGDLLIEAMNIIFENGAFITSETLGGGDGGNITMHAKGLISMTGHDSEGWGCNVYSTTDPGSTGGKSGNIMIDAADILLSDGIFLTTTAYGPGDGGDVMVKASGRVTLSGTDSAEGWVTTISSGSNPRYEARSGGNGGSVTVEANELFLENGAQISSNSIAPEGKTSGSAGAVTIQVASETRISGVNPHGENEDGFGSGIYARSWGAGDSAGAGGKIHLETGSLVIEDGGVIESSTNNNAAGGDIDISVQESLTLSGDASGITLEEMLYSQEEYLDAFNPTSYNRSVSGIYANSESIDIEGGPGGLITLSANTLTLSNSARLSTSSSGGGKAGDIHITAMNFYLEQDAAISSESLSENFGGKAGTIDLNAGEILSLTNGASLSTEAKGAGGGEISVSAGELLYLLDSEVTSSVQQGEGNGGDVIMDSKMIILNHSWTKANAEEGDGGAVFIQTDNFIKSRESRVTATSRRGNDGTVTIEAPELGIVSGLAVLQADFLDASQWLAQPCATRCGDTVSRFFIGGRDQTALAPDTIQDSGMFWLDGAEKTR